jgi:HAD superfamily hydrolase (TIGR01662 family)
LTAASTGGIETGVPYQSVIFDYGLTLVGFARPEAAIDRAQGAIADLIHAAGHDRPSMVRLQAEVHERVEAEVAAHEASQALEEVDIADVERRAFAAVGLHLDAALLDRCSLMIQEAWLDGVHLFADVAPALTLLRERGLRIGLCSNAAYRPASMHAQLAHLGLDRLLDAAVFSAEVRWRKPSPRMFEAALTSLGATAATTLFVGDRLREDVSGARAAGMRALLIDRCATSAPSSGVGPRADRLSEPDAVIRTLAELPDMIGESAISRSHGRRI